MNKNSKTAIIYYSLTDNTSHVAQLLKQELSTDNIIKLEVDNEPEKNRGHVFSGEERVYF